jgi:release factor glutamine methyltransferase
MVEILLEEFMMEERNYTIGEILIKSENYLKKKGIKNPRLEAELLLSFAHSTDRLWVYTNWFEKIEKDKLEKLRDFLLKRANGEPLHYILGYKEFMTLKLTVEPGVLVPRFETEELVEKVVEESREKEFKIFADIGCGSGAIAVSIAKFVENSFVYACDISEKAVELTTKNARINGVENRIRVFKGDLLEPLTPFLDEIEVFVSNPPYVSYDEWKNLDVEVKDYEPQEALIAPENGLFYYRKIIETLMNKKGKILYFEVSPARIDRLKKLIEDFNIKNYEVFDDTSRKARILKIVL